uniref:Protein arginine N-methyltransferase 7 n=1 Tax=Anthurium amnicola TaxID=1678845 RepID=A0A1D1YMR7_9ARAE
MTASRLSRAGIASAPRFLPGLSFPSAAPPSPLLGRGLVPGGAARAMSAAATSRVFQLRVNPLTGDSEWVVVEETDAMEHDDGNGAFGPHKSLLASTSYLDMLNDSDRNRAFQRAIRKAVTRPCHVLDIGAGTGLLSMMAAKAMEECGGGRGCDEGTVSACESYLPMGKLMRRVLRANGMENKIRVHHKRSDELRVCVDLPCRADVMVSEILDSELLGEGLIPTLQHAHDMLVAENLKTVPYRATTYGQLVESTFLWKLHDLYSCEVSASDGVHLAPYGSENIVSVRPKQYAMHCDALSQEIRLLSDPFKIFEFDFSQRPDSHGETNLYIKAIDDGNIHAVVSWWVIQLDDEGSIFYSTAPRWMNSSNIPGAQTAISDSKVWCDHWKQCVWFTPGTGVPVSINEEISFQARHDETSISYSVGNKYQGMELSNCGCETADNQLILSPERVGIYGDKDWRSSFLTATRNALEGKSCPLCVVADDSIFLTITAACLSKDSHVVSMFPGLRDMGAAYLKAIADSNGILNDHIRILGKRVSCVIPENLSQRKVDLFVAEPFYCGTEGLLPWQNLRFWKERSLLDSILSEDVSIIPCKGILKACAMSLPNLWNSRHCLKEVEGFDHSAVNDTIGACGGLSPGLEDPYLPYFIWQCGETKELSEVVSIMEFNFLDLIHPCFGKNEIEFTGPGICHGFALWVDWVIDERNSIVISTGPATRHWKQGVKLLSKAMLVNSRGSCNRDECHSTGMEASFDPSNGDLSIRCSFSIKD